MPAKKPKRISGGRDATKKAASAAGGSEAANEKAARAAGGSGAAEVEVGTNA